MKRALVSLDAAKGQVWQGKRRLELPPKAFAVLRYLMEHADRVVSKDELLTAVWPGIVVSEWALTTCLRRLRRALGETAQTPQYIETMSRRGYRWIGPFAAAPRVQNAKLKIQNFTSPSPSRPFTPSSSFAGREAELEQLYQWLEKVRKGERQLVFVTGEAGVGKTALVDAFVAQIAARERVQSAQPAGKSLKSVVNNPESQVWVARGQCIEHYGAGEAYLPVLEALGRLCHGPRQEPLVSLLRQYAPTWLVQLPWLLSPADRQRLQREMFGATRERMLREMAEMIEVLTAAGRDADPPLLVLVLEDLHWGDYATLDLLSSLAQRRDAARLLVLATFRPVEVIVREHPLRGVKQALQQHGQCVELRLEGLAEAEVGEYLTRRFATSPAPASIGEASSEPSRSSVMSPQSLAPAIYQHTNGNPLFVVNTVDDLVARGVIVQDEEHWEVQGKLEDIELGLPENLRQMLREQVERLSTEEQRVLEAASVAGVEFSVAAVAAEEEEELGLVEERCEGLARRGQFLRLAGESEWPDGTVAGRYSFLHALYQHVLYERTTARRRSHLHQRIGKRLEEAYSERAREIAAALAMHFERGQDAQRAVVYLHQAAENAMRRSAHREAIEHCTKGLELLQTLPDMPERGQQELMMQVTLAASLACAKGFAAPQVEPAYARARALCQQLGATPHLFPVLVGLWEFYFIRAELQIAHELGAQLVHLAQQTQDPVFLAAASPLLEANLFHLGELISVPTQQEQWMTISVPLQHPCSASPSGLDYQVACRSHAGWIRWHLGYPDQALKHSRAAVILAQDLLSPLNLCHAVLYTALLHSYRREGRETREQAEALMTLSTEQGFAYFLAIVPLLRGWALAEQGHQKEGIAQIRQGLCAYQATGAGLILPYFLALLAEAYGKAGQSEEGLTVVAEALAAADKTGEQVWEAELYRLRGELMLRQL